MAGDGKSTPENGSIAAGASLDAEAAVVGRSRIAALRWAVRGGRERSQQASLLAYFNRSGVLAGNRQPLAAVFGLGQRLSRRYFDQCQGSRVSIWRIGWSAMRSRTSAR